METQNKQWVCHPAPDHSGQSGPEDLSSSSKSLQNRSSVNDNQQNISSKDHQIISDIQNKNGLDQFFVQQVEDAICDDSRQIIIRILDEVARLTSIEKLLLYLKLPTDVTNISDPLRQPLNPLGSRTEISQTIMWIRTHLEEDPELSLPKQEVYNEYTAHCANNKMKPLSTADFGKVMKQVYPSVRPRRLGTRGNSRYCYAGLRKRFKLEVPQLPDLGDRPQSTEIICTQTDLTSAAGTIILEWAESILRIRFPSVYSLASYLVRHVPQNINISSEAAALLADYTEGLQTKDGMSQELLPYSNHVNLKHKEAQLHLQRKLQQREFKRKLQLQSPKAESKGKSKKSKLQSSGTPTRAISLDSVESESPKSQGYQLNTVCDKSTNECTNVTTLPNFSSFHVKKPLDEEKPLTKKDKVPSTQVSRSNSLENEMYETPAEEPIPELKPNFAGKLPIPRLPHKMKSVIHPPKNMILQAPKKGHRNLKYKAIQPKPAKTEHTQDNLDTTDMISDETLKNTDYLTRERLISVSQVDKDALDDYLHGGSNSQEQEEELMQYFKNNNNANNDGSERNVTTTQRDPDEGSSKSDKLSQLRLLLEQNLMGAPPVNEPLKSMKNINPTTSAFIKTAGLNMSQNLQLQSHLNSSGVKRRVSFETSVMENDTVPPSPNTRRKNFSFTPISPGPHSPGGRQSKGNSTNASPFVSPRNTPVPRAKVSHVPTSFVAQQPTTSASRKHSKPISLKPVLKRDPEIYTESDKLFGDLMEEKHFVNPTDIMPKCMPMSAPPSPMLPYKQKLNSNLLQKLLDSNSKVSYVPDYDKSVQRPNQDPLSQEVSQLLSENNAQNFNPVESYRSQSVPLHQMTSFKTLMSPCLPNSQQTHFNFNFNSANNSVAATPVPAEFSDFDTLTEINTGLNNENLNQILNILETQPNQIDETANVAASEAPQPQENVFNFDTNATNILNEELLNPAPQTVENQRQTTELMCVQKLIRSQSIDLDIEMRDFGPVPKYQQPSRSVPSTPLPYTKPKFQLNLNNNQTDLQPQMTEDIFANQDFLLNGQPVKGKNILNQNTSENRSFPTSLGFTMNEPIGIDNKNNVGRNFVARRNLNPLLEQQYAETDEFTAVPRINSGTS